MQPGLSSNQSTISWRPDAHNYFEVGFHGPHDVVMKVELVGKVVVLQAKGPPTPGLHAAMRRSVPT